MRLHNFLKAVVLVIFLGGFCALLLLLPPPATAQETNPVDRKVGNPMSDTPNVNPLAQEEIKPPQTRKKNEPAATEGGGDEMVVYSSREESVGKEGSRIVTHTGNVDVHFGIYRMQADKITINEATNMILAEGNVVFDQGNDQRITGTKSEWNYKTKLGYFINSTGFTNQTYDGTIIYFTASRVERVALNEIVVHDGKFTACEDAVPKWSFTSKKATIKTNEVLKMKNPVFRVRDIPVFPLPYASISLKKRDRKSGFLTPNFGSSNNKGFRLSGAYYQTLGRSADVTFRLDLYSSRGIGYGFDARTRANSRSYLNFGFYAVKDRIFGEKESAAKPNQGGTFVYAQGVHYFANGFTASADVKLTSNLAFRQVFFDSIQQIISPIEGSQVFINKSWNNYTLDVLMRSMVISIPNVRVKTRNLPSINFEKRPARLSFFKPAYFSFKTSLEGVSRREAVDDLNLYRSLTGSDPIVTPAVGQRFDFNPQLSIPFSTKYFNFTATGGFRTTYYSNSLDGFRRVLGKDLTRTYGEFEFDVRPVALAKNFYNKNDAFSFRHSIEPFLTYRYIKGVNNFNRIIRFDYIDTKTDTNEIEYGVTNRIFVRRYTEAISAEAQKLLREKPNSTINPLSIQPFEIFTFTVRGKYFFDPYFGGALVPGQRNQIDSITSLTAFTFGGVPRRFSPLNIDATYRPLAGSLFVNTRMNIGVQGEWLRDISATIGYNSKLLNVFQTFYYTRAVTLIPSLRQFNNPFGKEAGTLRGSQYSPSIFIGDRNKGVFGGVSLFFDFQNRRESHTSPLISSTGTIGYAFDCCSVVLQAYTFNLGVRVENRFVFSFRLNGIGTFGTEQLGGVLYK